MRLKSAPRLPVGESGRPAGSSYRRPNIHRFGGRIGNPHHHWELLKGGSYIIHGPAGRGGRPFLQGPLAGDSARCSADYFSPCRGQELGGFAGYCYVPCV